MKHVLFVDDEPQVLAALRYTLRRTRDRWQTSFACGATEALRQVETQRFDVVVTDMSMPGMDGADLLSEVKAVQPTAMRVILSGQIDERALARTLFIAHQFLAKPCAPGAIEGVLDRAFLLDELVGNAAVRAVLGGVHGLPYRPERCAQLTRMLAESAPPMREVGRTLGSDISLAAKVLQLANSALFGQPGRVTDLTVAAGCLGASTLATLVVGLTSLGPGAGRPAPELETIWRRSVITARLAKEIMLKQGSDGQVAYVGGLLHEVGLLVTTGSVADEPFHHAIAGAYLLGLWGFPLSVVDAVAFHAGRERPSRERTEFDSTDAVCFAARVADEVIGETAPSRQPREAIAVREPPGLDVRAAVTMVRTWADHLPCD